MTLYRATAEGQIPMTAEEEAEFLAIQAAHTAAAQKDAIQQRIDFLERESLMNRGTRELQLRLMEKEAADLAAQRGISVDQVLASVPAYVKFKALDDEITALKAQL